MFSIETMGSFFHLMHSNDKIIVYNTLLPLLLLYEYDQMSFTGSYNEGPSVERIRRLDKMRTDVNRAEIGVKSILTDIEETCQAQG